MEHDEQLDEEEEHLATAPRWLGLALGGVAIAVVSFFVGYAARGDSASAAGGDRFGGPGAVNGFGFQGGTNGFAPPGFGSNGSGNGSSVGGTAFGLISGVDRGTITVEGPNGTTRVHVHRDTEVTAADGSDASFGDLEEGAFVRVSGDTRPDGGIDAGEIVLMNRMSLGGGLGGMPGPGRRTT